MKISNETKVGALTVIAVFMLIMGFNFLKGKNLFKKGTFLYAKYTDTKGLTSSNVVTVNGFQVGAVYDIEASKDLTGLVVRIKLNEKYQIPRNSVAVIKTNPLAGSSMEIIMGNSQANIENGDTLRTSNDSGIFGELTAKVGPVADQLTATMADLDSLLINFNNILDPGTKNNLQSVIANLNRATAGLVVTGAQLQQLLNTQNGALAKTLGNADKFSANLAANNSKITNTLTNLETATGKLSRVNIDSITYSLNQSTAKLNQVMTKLTTKEGNIGRLLNDEGLYNSLANTLVSINTLTDDLRAHPRRYVNISVFGKKDQGNYLTAPLPLDTTRYKVKVTKVE